MNILILNDSTKSMGGGWSFLENLQSENLSEMYFTNDINASYDIVFIPSATMVLRESLNQAMQEKNGKKPKLVIRVDNIPEDARNRGTAWSRLKEYCELADLVIFQSEWAKKLILPALNVAKSKTKVIYNGVNNNIFKPEGEKYDFGQFSPRLLYVSSSTNVNKRFGEVIYMYREYWNWCKANGAANPILVLVGKGFDPKQEEYNFEFHNGERILYMGEVHNRQELAKIYRSCDLLLFPNYAEACPNTVLEAMATGLNILYNPYGATRELVDVLGVPIDYLRNSAECLVDVASALKFSYSDKMIARIKNDFTNRKMAIKYFNALNELLP